MKNSVPDDFNMVSVDTMWAKSKNAKPGSPNQLVCLCAIPHWFDRDIAQALVGSELNDAVNRLVARYPSFIRTHPQDFTYHESIRQAFWQKWHLDDPEKLIEISKRLVEYFDRAVENVTFSQRLDFEYERMYHLITIDPTRGFDELDTFFRIAEDNHQIEACHRLVDQVSEHLSYLPDKFRTRFKYYQGELARELHQSELAESIFSELLGIDELDELTRAKAGNSMALSIISAQTNLNDAFPFLVKSVEILRKINNLDWLAQVLYNLSYVSRLAGKREDAYEYGEESLRILETHRQPDNVIWLVKKSRVLSELGLVLWLLGDPDRARERFNEALSIQLRIGAKDSAIETYANLGRLERTSGHWDEAIRQLQNSIQLAAETKNQHQMAWTKNALGNVYVEMEDWVHALECFEESQQLWENIGHQHERGIPVKNLIGVYAALGNWDLAEKAADEALTIFATHEGRKGEIYNSLGELLFMQERYAAAKLNFVQALELADKIKDRKTAPRVRVNLAQLDLILGDLVAARQVAEQALQQGRDYKQPDRIAQALLITGNIDLLEAKLEQAAEKFILACSTAQAFNSKVYEVTLFKILELVASTWKIKPELNWPLFIERLTSLAAIGGNDKILISAIRELSEGKRDDE